MTSFELLVCLFPIVFMFHDFEEIICFKPWINKNRNYLSNRFPKISARFLPRMEKLSTSGFALAIAEEFVLLSVITYASIYSGNYSLWFAAFMAFSIHLIIHILQWMVVRKYIPTIITSILALPYCYYTLTTVLEKNMFSILEIVYLSIIAIVIGGLNLVFAHKLGEMFDKWAFR